MTLIHTKLSPPPLRPGAVERRQLLPALLGGEMRKLTLVSAPAGFGKSTLLAQWYRSAAARGVRCAWLALHHDDAEPLRFLSYFIAACRRQQPGFGTAVLQRLESSAPADIAELLPEIIADLGQDGSPHMLFIDDAHHAGQPAIAHFLELLCNLSPAAFHLVLAGRIRPNLPLAAFRVRNQLQEINSTQLRFDRAESERFLRSVHGIHLTAEQMDSLHAHSEGWVAGLQLASLSLREQARPDEFIDAFSGNLRDVTEYLASDVLDKQPADVRAFLLRTCILDRLNAAVCAELTGSARAREMIEALEDQNLFLLPLDGERNWYRYHQLFQEFLQGQLRRRHPGEVVGLYRRAADWFNGAGFAAEAVEYALLSGDIRRATELIVPQVQQEMMAGRMPRVSDWIERIPEQDRNANPALLKANATALFHMNRSDATSRITDELQRLEGAESSNVRLLRAGIAISRDDVAPILDHLADLPADMSRFDLGTIHNIRGYAQQELAQYDAARASLAQARAYHDDLGSTFGVVYADCFRAFMDFARGDLDAVHARFAPADGAAGCADTYVTPVPAVMRGLVLYEWNRHEEAVALLRPNVPLLEQVGHIKLLALGRIALAKLALRAGDCDRLNLHLDRCLELGASRGAHLGRLQSLVEGERIRLMLAHGFTALARDRAALLGIDGAAPAAALPDHWERVACLNALTWCRMQVAAGQPARALPQLAQLQRLSRAAMRSRRLLECLLVETAAHCAAGTPERAVAPLAKALQLAATGRQMMAFLDEGPVLHGALHTQPAPSDVMVAGFLAQLRSALAPRDPGVRAAPAALLEEFSAREREILGHVAAGHSNAIIAEQLAISENTVKWHLKNLFQKLGVKNRTAAVDAARRLGWI